MDPISNDHDDLVAYVFQPDEDDDVFPGDRPLKKRRTGPKNPDPPSTVPSSNFVPLLNGVETTAATALREHLFRTHWNTLNDHITHILRSANHDTLEQVLSFVNDTAATLGPDDSRIPTAFVITGPNIASQDLLFEQLTENLTAMLPARFVRLRSVEAGTVKAALKQIVRGVTATHGEQRHKNNMSKAPLDANGEDDEDGEVSAGVGAGAKFLDYDLAALKAYLDNQATPCEHIIIAFQDGEGFDSGLLSDLITLFHSWRGQIPFTLLFGIATSTEMLQARLLKSTCRMLYGAQFDVVQSATILERVFRQAVVARDTPLRIGPNLLRAFLNRQQDQVAGIQSFINSLKYAFMSHFYANPLSLLIGENLNSTIVTPELLEGIKSMPSFHEYIETLISQGYYSTAKSFLIDPEALRSQISVWNGRRKGYVCQLLAATEVVCAAEKRTNAYIDVYIELMADGISLSPSSPTMAALKRMTPETIMAVIGHFVHASPEKLHGLLSPKCAARLTEISVKIASLQASNNGLHNLSASPSKTARSTAIAQRAQLIHDSSNATSADHTFTQLVEQLCVVLTQFVRNAGDAYLDDTTSAADDAPVNIFPAAQMLLHEAWVYDNRTPHRDVFVPRPRLVFERGLTRPQDYLACSCCSDDKAGVPPATCILYRLYLETGSLINVADLWTAFKGTLGPKTDERQALSLFYRGLAELRLLGYIKASRKKADHISKVKWM